MTNPASLTPATENATDKAWLPYIWSMVGFAIVLRLQQFALNPAVWIDELWILRNITRKNFLELTGTLTDVQAAPPIFLWIERAIWLVFGDNIFALRALPLVASCIMVTLLVPFGRGLIRMPALFMALILMGFSDKLLDFSCEVKPYVLDGMIAAILFVVFRATQSWTTRSRLLLFAGLAPLTLFTSYAGCFLYAGLMLAFIPETWLNRFQWRTWLCWCVLILTVSIAFYFLYTGPIRAQRTPQMDTFWRDYPDWHRPWTVPFWTVYSFGVYLERLWRPTGMILIVPIVVGASVLWRRSVRGELIFLLAPLILVMLAAWAGKYPFETRLIVFTAPSVFVLAAEGLLEMGLWIRQRAIWSSTVMQTTSNRVLRAAVVLSCIALVIPVIHTSKHIVSVRRRAAQAWPESPSNPGPVNAGKPGVPLYR